MPKKTIITVEPSSYNFTGNKLKLILKMHSSEDFSLTREDCDEMLEEIRKSVKNIVENAYQFQNPLKKYK